MLLKSEKFAQEYIVEAVYAIEEMNRLSRQAIQLNERMKSGLLSESNARLLKEDLDKAMSDLQTSAQKGMGKVDKAIDFLETFGSVCDTASASPDDFWAKIKPAFDQAKEVVTELANLDIGTIDSIKSLFSDGGKYAAVMDNLAAEMSINAVFVKMISGGLAQLIRSLKTFDSEYAKDPANKKGGITLEEYITNSGSNLTAADIIDAFEDAAEEVQTNNGGYAFNLKGIKNFFSKNAGTIGLAAAGAGLAFFTGGVALPGILGALALGSAAYKGQKREPDDAMGAYNVDLGDLAASLLVTQMSALEGGIPLFVKAVKGVNDKEFAEAAEEAKKAISSITKGVDVEDLMNKYIEDYGDQAVNLKTLYSLDKARTISMFSDYVQNPDAFNNTTIVNDFADMQEEAGLVSESFLVGTEKDMVLEAGNLHHRASLTSLLYEEAMDEKKGKGSKGKSKSKSKSKSSTSKSSGVSKSQYKKNKQSMTDFAKDKLKRATKDPSTKSKYEKAVDRKERSLNKKMTNPDRKRNITNIANEYEKKIRDLEDKPSSSKPASEKDTAPNKSSDTSNAPAEEESGGGGLVGSLMDKGKDALKSGLNDLVPQDMPFREKALDMASDFIDSKGDELADAGAAAVEGQLEDIMSDASGTEVDIPSRSPRRSRSSSSGGAAMEDLIAKIPSFSDLKGGKRLKDKDRKYLQVLAGEKGGSGRERNEFVDAMFAESYDRRLLKLSGL